MDGVADLKTRLKQALTECDHLRRENQRLKDRLAQSPPEDVSALVTEPSPEQGSPPATEVHSHSPASAKVKLFRSLFRGRDDIYAVRWESKAGKSGYSPACSNEWIAGVCEKPRNKCGTCARRVFLPLDVEAVEAHLRGAKTLGVYPLLEDETCWFLAADFDKTSWKEDARAFVAAARELGVPAALEQSRSGHGAHVWMFFDNRIDAALARELGSAILTRAMESRNQMGMDSYDRFFPSQDTMPKGGFGNLIALPLQGGPRQEGNSVFLEDDFEPFQEQWAYT